MQPNFLMMWETLKEVLPQMTVEDNMIHLEDLERAMDQIEADYKCG